MGRSLPSRESSPKKSLSLTSKESSLAAIIYARDIGKSKKGPSFFTSAGERETTTFWFLCLGEVKLEFSSAEPTRSRDSSTALSGRPTTEKE